MNKGYAKRIKDLIRDCGPLSLKEIKEFLDDIGHSTISSNLYTAMQNGTILYKDGKYSYNKKEEKPIKIKEGDIIGKIKVLSKRSYVSIVTEYIRKKEMVETKELISHFDAIPKSAIYSAVSELTKRKIIERVRVGWYRWTPTPIEQVIQDQKEEIVYSKVPIEEEVKYSIVTIELLVPNDGKATRTKELLDDFQNCMDPDVEQLRMINSKTASKDDFVKIEVVRFKR